MNSKFQRLPSQLARVNVTVENYSLNDKICMGRCGPFILAPWSARAESVCPRPEPGSIVEEPEDLRSQNGVLEAQLTASNAAEADGSMRYCYTDAAGRESPNLRVHPGDLVVLHLTNALTDGQPAGMAAPMHAHAHASLPIPAPAG